jgi:hypothetical protein
MGAVELGLGVVVAVGVEAGALEVVDQAHARGVVATRRAVAAQSGWTRPGVESLACARAAHHRGEHRVDVAQTDEVSRGVDARIRLEARKRVHLQKEDLVVRGDAKVESAQITHSEHLDGAASVGGQPVDDR